jgi:hypothetical protein
MKRATELKKNASDVIQDQTQNANKSLDAVKQQLLDYANQIREYLNRVDAKVDGYKCSIEKQEDGLTIDIGFRATIHPKGSTKPMK